MPAIIDQMQRIAQIARRCPEPTLVLAYRDAVRKFCNESRWLRRQSVTATVDGELQYALPLDTGETGLEIIGVRVLACQADVPQQSWTLAPSDPTTWNQNLQPARPTIYAYVPEAQVALNPIPDGAYSLTATVQVQPTDDADEIPDDLMRKWHLAFADGTLAYLLSIPGQAWSNPQGGAYYTRRFQAAINNARADEQRSYNTGTVMARIRRMF